jgi:hypothetical protein
LVFCCWVILEEACVILSHHLCFNIGKRHLTNIMFVYEFCFRSRVEMCMYDVLVQFNRKQFQVVVFLIVTLYSDLLGYQCSRSPCCMEAALT